MSKKYDCNACGKTFTDRGELAVHVMDGGESHTLGKKWAEGYLAGKPPRSGQTQKNSQAEDARDYLRLAIECLKAGAITKIDEIYPLAEKMAKWVEDYKNRDLFEELPPEGE